MGVTLNEPWMLRPPSPRELEVAKLVALGNSNKMVADILHLSIRTVETHRAHLMRKQKLRCAADITRWAIQRKLVLYETKEPEHAAK